MVAERVEYETRRSDTLTTATRVNTGSYRFVRLSNAGFSGLKIRCPQGRAGSTPALGTKHSQLMVKWFEGLGQQTLRARS